MISVLTKSHKRINNSNQITSPGREESAKMEIVAKAIILCLLAISGAAAVVTYMYDPTFFKYALEGKPVDNSENYRIETVYPSKLTRYKQHLLENSQVETQPPENTNPNPEQLWMDTYHKPRSSE